MDKPEPKHFAGWNGPLLPFSAFHEYYTRGHTWSAGKYEYIIPRSLNERLRIVEERSDDWTMKDMARTDTLAENGIYDADEDAKETAKMLFDTLFQSFSEHEMRHIMTELLNYCNNSEKYRRQHCGPVYELIDVDFNKYDPKAYETNSSTEPLQEHGGQHEDEGQEGS